MKSETYTAIYKKGITLPVALFLNPQDADEWCANPVLYSSCRRRVFVSPDQKEIDANESEAMRLLRILVKPGDDPQYEVGRAIESGQKLLGLKSK